MLAYAPLLLWFCCLALGGCSVAAGFGMPTERPTMHRLAQPMFPNIISMEQTRCEGGYYKGASVEALLSDTSKKWGAADSKYGPWKVYTFIYYKNVAALDKSNDWYEHWYQLYDYDKDGKIDDCKYLEIHKGNISPRVDPFYEDFVKKNQKESEDYKKRHGLKF